MLRRQLRIDEEIAVKELFESVAARAAGGWQRAGAKFDFEVLAMPGGSVIAPVLWAYSMTMSLVKSSQHSAENHQSASDAPAAEHTPPTQLEEVRSCAWFRGHCA
jgi:hypothetical protein